MMGRQLKVDHTQVYRWIRAYGESLPEPEIPCGIKEMEFDAMWHFIGAKKTNFGSSKPLTAAVGELSPRFSAVVMLQHADDTTKK
jgi:hypothetical protein